MQRADGRRLGEGTLLGGSEACACTPTHKRSTPPFDHAAAGKKTLWADELNREWQGDRTSQALRRPTEKLDRLYPSASATYGMVRGWTVRFLEFCPFARISSFAARSPTGRQEMDGMARAWGGRTAGASTGSTFTEPSHAHVRQSTRSSRAECLFSAILHHFLISGGCKIE